MTFRSSTIPRFPYIRNVLWLRPDADADTVNVNWRTVVPAIEFENSLLESICATHDLNGSDTACPIRLMSNVLLPDVVGEPFTYEMHPSNNVDSPDIVLEKVSGNVESLQSSDTIIESQLPFPESETLRRSQSNLLSGRNGLNISSPYYILSPRAEYRILRTLDDFRLGPRCHSLFIDMDLHVPAMTLQTKIISSAPSIAATPIAISLCTTGLLHSDSKIHGVQCGFLTLDETRQAVPLLLSDPLVPLVPLVGVWIRAPASSSNLVPSSDGIHTEGNKSTAGSLRSGSDAGAASATNGSLLPKKAGKRRFPAWAQLALHHPAFFALLALLESSPQLGERASMPECPHSRLVLVLPPMSKTSDAVRSSQTIVRLTGAGDDLNPVFAETRVDWPALAVSSVSGGSVSGSENGGAFFAGNPQWAHVPVQLRIPLISTGRQVNLDPHFLSHQHNPSSFAKSLTSGVQSSLENSNTQKNGEEFGVTPAFSVGFLTRYIDRVRWSLEAPLVFHRFRFIEGNDNMRKLKATSSISSSEAYFRASALPKASESASIPAHTPLKAGSTLRTEKDAPTAAKVSFAVGDTANVRTPSRIQPKYLPFSRNSVVNYSAPASETKPVAHSNKDGGIDKITVQKVLDVGRRLDQLASAVAADIRATPSSSVLPDPWTTTPSVSMPVAEQMERSFVGMRGGGISSPLFAHDRTDNIFEDETDAALHSELSDLRERSKEALSVATRLVSRQQDLLFLEAVESRRQQLREEAERKRWELVEEERAAARAREGLLPSIAEIQTPHQVRAARANDVLRHNSSFSPSSLQNKVDIGSSVKEGSLGSPSKLSNELEMLKSRVLSNAGIPQKTNLLISSIKTISPKNIATTFDDDSDDEIVPVQLMNVPNWVLPDNSNFLPSVTL